MVPVPPSGVSARLMPLAGVLSPTILTSTFSLAISGAIAILFSTNILSQACWLVAFLYGLASLIHAVDRINCSYVTVYINTPLSVLQKGIVNGTCRSWMNIIVAELINSVILLHDLSTTTAIMMDPSSAQVLFS